MISYQQYEEAERMYPMPEYVSWYQRSFPSKQLAVIGSVIIMIGMIMTIAKVAKFRLLFITLQILSLIVWLCSMLLVAIVKKRNTYKKRAQYLHVTLHEYLKYDLVDNSVTGELLRWYDRNFGY